MSKLQPVAYPVIAPGDVAWITEVDMIEVDRAMIDDLHIELLQMMENAGRNLARLVLDLAHPASVAIAAGSGGNGGGGLVAARHLANAGVDVVVTTTRASDQMSPTAAHQLGILKRMGVARSDELAECEVVVDAVIGYSLRGAPVGQSARLIERVNLAPIVVSLDTPSGVNVNSGETPGVAVVADATMTLALPKVGLRSASQVGDLYLADISVPRSVAARWGSAPDFSGGSILHVDL